MEINQSILLVLKNKIKEKRKKRKAKKIKSNKSTIEAITIIEKKKLINKDEE